MLYSAQRRKDRYMSSQTTRQSRRVLIALATCMALQMTGLVLTLPLFARRFESFGAGVQALGASAMAYALTTTIAAPFAGALADRIGRRPVILFSLACYVLAFGGYLFATSAWMLIFVRGLAGAVTAGLLPAMTGVVGDVAPENRRARWLGIVTGGASIGWIVGPLLGGLLYDQFGYVVPFAASIAMAVGALLLAILSIPETHITAPQSSQPRASWSHAVTHIRTRDRGAFSVTACERLGLGALPNRSIFLFLLLIIFGVMFAWAFIEPQFMFYAYDDLAWSSAQLGLVMSVYGVAFMLGAFALGQSSDHFGRKPVLVLGLALFSAQFAGLVAFHDATWIAVTFVLAGLGNALYDPALSAFILDITPPEHTASRIGLKSTAGSLGSMLGPALVVLIAPVAGPQVVFLLAAALVVTLTLASAFMLRVPTSKGTGDFGHAALEHKGESLHV